MGRKRKGWHATEVVVDDLCDNRISYISGDFAVAWSESVG